MFIFFLFFKIKNNKISNDFSENFPVSNKEAKKTPLPVKVEPARYDDLIIYLKTPGIAVSNHKIDMKADISGTIEKIFVRESQHVNKGDILVQLDDTEYELDLQQEEAEYLSSLSEYMLDQEFEHKDKTKTDEDINKLKKAKEDFKHIIALYNEKQISKQEFERHKQDYESLLIGFGEKSEQVRASVKGLTQAKIRVKKAKINLEKTKIKAPFSGRVCDIKISPNETITSGSELFTLVNIEKIQVKARGLESEIGKIKTGRQAEIIFSAYPEILFSGTIQSISPLVDPENNTCDIFIEVPNPEEKIKPGMHAEVNIISEIYEHRLLVSQEALLVRNGRKLVFVIKDGLSKWRYTEVGKVNERDVEILNGVQEGELVAVSGHLTLSHDASVQIIE